ncbi:MAG: hypothetical protein NTU45_15390 [Planctomycetota bacterium]|nr:hypothetical protein [Planctomycetota bacterium]
MQTAPPAKPIPPERLAQLTGTWRQIIELRRQAEVTEDETRIKTNEDAARALESELLSQPEGELTIEMMKLDARLLVMTRAAESEARSVIGNLNEYLLKTLEVRQLSVEVAIDDLGTLSLTGPRWMVQEAMNIANDLNATIAQRIEEIRKAEFERIDQQRLDAERLEQARRRADQETLRAKSVNISWAGGRLGDLIAAVQKQAACNVVLGDPTIADVAVPALSVQMMSPEVFFQMLPQLPGQPGSEISVFVVSATSIDPASTAPPKDDGSMSAIMITRPGSKTEFTNEVFDVRWCVQPDATSQLADSIAFAMNAAGFTDKVKIRLHAQSNLLFVQGPLEAVALVGKVIQATKAK